jgi:hypothetical protein
VQRAVEIECRAELLGEPLAGLTDVALKQADTERLTGWCRPVTAAPCERPTPQAGQHQQRQQPASDAWRGEQCPQQARAEGGEESDRETATQRGEHGQRTVDLADAERQPRKAGQQPATHPFEQHPARGKQQHDAPGRPPRAPGPDQQRGEQRRVEREVGNQREGDRERCRQAVATELVDAHVHPPDAESEHAEAEQPATPGRAARCRDQPGVQRERDAEQRQRVPAEGGETERHQQPRDEREGVAAVPGDRGHEV